jgi:hypothetical protein
MMREKTSWGAYALTYDMLRMKRMLLKIKNI